MALILGIDPGSRITGYGLVKEHNQKLLYVDSGCIRTSHSELSQRLLEIFNGIRQIMEAFSPDEVAIEQVFIHQNASSALKLGHARGAGMVACASVPIHEYSAREVKQSVVGYGAAQKNQVKQMVINLLMLESAPQSDAADALAIAICHSHTRNSLVQMSALARRRRALAGRRRKK